MGLLGNLRAPQQQAQCFLGRVLVVGARRVVAAAVGIYSGML
jgi:hypothetical protein